MLELTRVDLQGLSAKPLREGISHKPDLLVYDVGGEKVVLKDYSRKRAPWRNVLGVIFTWREARALRALSGVAGVPQFRGRPDRHCVAMTFVKGRRAKKTDPDVKGNEEFVRALEQTVSEMHIRGVVHLDLKHRSNLMVSPQRLPVVLDFESALCFSPSWFGGRLAVRLLGQLDRLALQNWKRRFCPHMLSGSDLRRAQLARQLKGWWLPGRAIAAFRDIFERRHRPPDP
ncbi:MAG: RIO1 family regulatory kinase/ATPase domain-containing protein [Planctomycetota bacterium]|jgi:predicted Ser/Thr protein kinase